MASAGQSIGRYQIVAKLGDNTAGERYRAHDPNLRRDVVLTVIAKDRAASAQALAKLQHPNVIGVYDVGAYGGDVYIASELVEGTSLAAWLSEKPRTWRDIVAAFQQVGQGIAAAHAVGLAHGPLEPSEVIVGNDGRIRVRDFHPPTPEASEHTDQRSFCAALDDALAKSRSVPARLRQITQSDGFPSMRALLDALAVDPTTRHKRWLVAGGVIAVAAATVLGIAMFGHPPDASCTSARPLLDDAWGPQQRAKLGAAFAHLDQPWAKAVHATVENLLDRYTTRWVDMHHESCEATHVRHDQSPLVLDLRSECLGRHLDEVREIVAVLTEGDSETLEQSITIIDGLPSLDDCADVAALTAPVRPPASPEARAAVDGLRKQLARGRALATAAKFVEAAQVASKVVDRARELHYRPLEAEALLDLSNAFERQGNYREAEEVAQNASHAAQAGKHDQVAAQALIALVWLTGGRQRRYDRAHDFASQAAAAIERLDHKADLQGELARSLGATYANEGRLDDALKQDGRYLEIVESSDGATAPIVGGVLVDIGEIYREQGRYDEALARYGRALKIFEATYGTEHPTVAVPLNDLGLVSHRIGRDAEALEYHQRALSIFERSLGANHPHVAEARTDIGVVLLAQGKAEEAYDQFQRALAIDANVSGATSAEAAIDLINMADARRAAHMLDEAVHDNQHAVEIAKASVGDEDPIVAEGYLSLGRTLAASGKHPDAIVAFEHALAIWQRPDAELDAGAGEAFSALGASQLALGRRKEATASAERAIDLLERSSRDPKALPAARELLTRSFGVKHTVP